MALMTCHLGHFFHLLRRYIGRLTVKSARRFSHKKPRWIIKLRASI